MQITEKEFKQLARYIEEHYGIHLKDEKKMLLVGRLQRVVQEQHFNSFSEYYRYLISDASRQAATTLLNHITTNHTFFMREADHFTYFRDQVLPFLRDTVADHDLRIWSAGCSSGEEPYGLSMIIHDFFGKSAYFWNTQLLATDISEKVLLKAKAGRYTTKQMEQVPFQWRRDYFQKRADQMWEVTERIKSDIVFRRFNLMDRIFPFKKKFHVIFCRNVMIYFDDEVRNQLVGRFYDFTEPGGYLFIGHSETLNREMTGYKYIMPAVYRKMF